MPLHFTCPEEACLWIISQLEQIKKRYFVMYMQELADNPDNAEDIMKNSTHLKNFQTIQDINIENDFQFFLESKEQITREELIDELNRKKKTSSCHALFDYYIHIIKKATWGKDADQLDPTINAHLAEMGNNEIVKDDDDYKAKQSRWIALFKYFEEDYLPRHTRLTQESLPFWTKLTTTTLNHHDLHSKSGSDNDERDDQTISNLLSNSNNNDDDDNDEQDFATPHQQSFPHLNNPQMTNVSIKIFKAVQRLKTTLKNISANDNQELTAFIRTIAILTEGFLTRRIRDLNKFLYTFENPHLQRKITAYILKVHFIALKNDTSIDPALNKATRKNFQKIHNLMLSRKRLGNEDIKILGNVVKQNIKLAFNPTEANLTKFQSLTKDLKSYRSIPTMIIGAMMVVAGAAIIVLSALTFTGTLGLSAPANMIGAAAGAGVVVAGLGLFAMHKGRNKGVAKYANNVIEQTEKFIARTQ